MGAAELGHTRKQALARHRQAETLTENQDHRKLRLEALRAATGTIHGTQIEHGDLLHRLVLKRCVYGVDISPMGAEVARLSLWLAAFVPGLSLAYLGHTVQVGDSLIGVADPAVLHGENNQGMRPIYADQVDDAIAVAGRAAAELATVTDRTPDDYARVQPLTSDSTRRWPESGGCMTRGQQAHWACLRPVPWCRPMPSA